MVTTSETHYVLDTDICIYAMKGTYPSLEEQFARRTPEVISIPAVVTAELLYGVEHSDSPETNQRVLEQFLDPFDVLPFTGSDAESYARIRESLEEIGSILAANDLLIAATCLSRGDTLVTHITSEFSRVEGLSIEDWTNPPPEEANE